MISDEKKDAFFGKSKEDVSDLELAARECEKLVGALPTRLALVAHDCVLKIRKLPEWTVYK